MFSHEFPEIVELFDVLVLATEFNLLFIIRKYFIEDLLVNDILSGFICKLVVQSEIFKEGLVDLRLTNLEFSLKLDLVEFQVYDTKYVSLRIELHLLDLFLLFL